MPVPIDKKSYYAMRFTKGTIIELAESICDEFSPKPKGAKFEVDYVDDALQLHGHWLAPESGSLAVDIERDRFQIVVK